MKVNKNSPAWTADYAIETEYGTLGCVLSPEEVEGHFYSFFSSFAESAEDYNSAIPRKAKGNVRGNR